MPMMQCGISQYFMTAVMPEMIVSLHSSISRAVGGQVGLALGSVDEQRVDGVGCQLDMRREAGAADTHQAAGLHGSQQAGFVGDDGRHTGRTTVCAPSVLMATAVVIAPLTMRSGAMSCTVPDTLE